MKKGLILLMSTVVAWGASNKVTQNRWFLEMEAGPVWQSRNEVKIPGTTGTKFSLKDFEGGPFLSGRVYGGYRWTDRSEFRALFAPLTLKGSRNLSSPIDFQNSTFTPGTDTHSIYKFNSYRLTYRYRLVDSDKWIFWIGFTGKIRDATVALEQGTISAEKKSLGFVPLLHFRLLYRVGPEWLLDLDGDALVAPQGRAEDVVVRINYQLNPEITVNVGYRLLEGGADNSRVYAFSFLHYLVAGMRIEL